LLSDGHVVRCTCDQVYNVNPIRCTSYLFRCTYSGVFVIICTCDQVFIAHVIRCTCGQMYMWSYVHAIRCTCYLFRCTYSSLFVIRCTWCQMYTWSGENVFRSCTSVKYTCYQTYVLYVFRCVYCQMYMLSGVHLGQVYMWSGVCVVKCSLHMWSGVHVVRCTCDQVYMCPDGHGFCSGVRVQVYFFSNVHVVRWTRDQVNIQSDEHCTSVKWTYCTCCMCSGVFAIRCKYYQMYMWFRCTTDQVYMWSGVHVVRCTCHQVYTWTGLHVFVRVYVFSCVYTRDHAGVQLYMQSGTCVSCTYYQTYVLCHVYM
jgi:hypothetical protein